MRARGVCARAFRQAHGRGRGPGGFMASYGGVAGARAAQCRRSEQSGLLAPAAGTSDSAGAGGTPAPTARVGGVPVCPWPMGLGRALVGTEQSRPGGVEGPLLSNGPSRIRALSLLFFSRRARGGFLTWAGPPLAHLLRVGLFQKKTSLAKGRGGRSGRSGRSRARRRGSS